VEREIEIIPEDELEELQPGQQVKSGIKEVIPPRRCERIHQQQEASVPQGPITRYQAKIFGSKDVTSLAVEDFDNDPLNLILTKIQPLRARASVALSRPSVLHRN
jgi:hypothetical protein